MGQGGSRGDRSARDVEPQHSDSDDDSDDEGAAKCGKVDRTSQFRDLQIPWFNKNVYKHFVPTIYEEHGKKADYAPGPSLVLACTGGWDGGDNPFEGRWVCNEKEIHEIKRGICGLYPSMSMRQMRHFSKSDHGKKLIKKMPGGVQGLLNSDLVRPAFAKFDIDNSGRLDSNEFHRFLQRLQEIHLQYYLQKNLMELRSYWGRNAPWAPDSLGDESGLNRTQLIVASGATLVDMPENRKQREKIEEQEGLIQISGKYKRNYRCVQVGYDKDCTSWNPVAPGMGYDFWYYSANNHPLHSIFCADPSNRLSGMERLAIELTVISFTLYVAKLQSKWVCMHQAPFAFLGSKLMFEILMLTVAGIVVHKILVLLYTCPGCGLVDKSTADPSQVQRARILSGIGSFIASLFVLAGLMYLAVNVFGQVFAFTPTEEGWQGGASSTGLSPAAQVAQFQAAMEASPDAAAAWQENPLALKCHVDNVSVFANACTGRVRSWFITWLVYTLLTFQIFFAWGNTDPNSGGGFFARIGDIVGIGQWRIEKQRFQAQIVQALQKMEEHWSITRNLTQAEHNLWQYACAPSKRDKHEQHEANH